MVKLELHKALIDPFFPKPLEKIRPGPPKPEQKTVGDAPTCTCWSSYRFCPCEKCGLYTQGHFIPIRTNQSLYRSIPDGADLLITLGSHEMLPHFADTDWTRSVNSVFGADRHTQTLLQQNVTHFCRALTPLEIGDFFKRCSCLCLL